MEPKDVPNVSFFFFASMCGLSSPSALGNHNLQSVSGEEGRPISLPHFQTLQAVLGWRPLALTGPSMRRPIEGANFSPAATTEKAAEVGNQEEES